MKPASEKCEHDWARFLRFFTDENNGRPTRLGMFEQNAGVANDYWIESGLPLTGTWMEVRDSKFSIGVELGSFTHEVNDASQLAFRFTRSGEEDGIDIIDSDGRTTILRFENSGR